MIVTEGEPHSKKAVAVVVHRWQQEGPGCFDGSDRNGTKCPRPRQQQLRVRLAGGKKYKYFDGLRSG
jgi:hypothetical protein